MMRLLVCLPLLLFVGFAQDDVSDQIREIEAMKRPEFDVSRVGEDRYRESYNGQLRQFQRDRSARIKDLVKQFPKNPQVRKLRMDWWLQLARTGEREALFEEITPLLNDSSDPNERLDLMYVRAESWAWAPKPFEQAMAAVDEFIKAAPKDERGAELLFYLGQADTNPERQLQQFRRAAAEPYAGTVYGKLANGSAIQVAGIGKPFELSFQDLTGGKPIDVARDFKGKIVVIYFWATWCAPCIAELPEYNKLSATYNNRGVEFIGVSRDAPESEGGLAALKKCIEENKITWPQYYPGDGPDGVFTSKWGIMVAPTIFILDRDGKLASTTASGKLKSVLDEMLNKETKR